LLKSAALMQSQVPNGRKQSLESWLKARDVLETLVRDQPANKDYQVRLAESLVNAARSQRTDKENEKAAANLKRAIEVREQLVAANPDDKALKQDLTTAQRDLERLEATPTASKEAPAAQSAAPPAEKDAAVAERKETPPSEGSPPAAEAKETPPPASNTKEAPAAETKEAPAADDKTPAAEDNPPAAAGETPRAGQ
jgi:membrane protein involved in colicin uptake